MKVQARPSVTAKNKGRQSPWMRSAVVLLATYAFMELLVFLNAIYIVVALNPPEWPVVPLVLGLALGAPAILLLIFCLRRSSWSFAAAVVLGIAGFTIELFLFLRPNGPSEFIATGYSVIPALVAVSSALSLADLRKQSRAAHLPPRE